LGAVVGGVVGYGVGSAACDRCDEPAPIYAMTALGALVGATAGAVAGAVTARRAVPSRVRAWGRRARCLTWRCS
jgi:hypothetical protein